jgi:uncharacterized LabA/DUF88 family protein
MIADSNFSRSSISSTLANIIATPRLIGVLKSLLVGSLVGIASWNPNLGLLSASVSLGLNLLDPNRLRRAEIGKLYEKQHLFEQVAASQITEIQRQLEYVKKAIQPRGRVMVFIDGSNLYFSKKGLGFEKKSIDYGKLLAYCQQGSSELTRVMFFVGIDPENVGQKYFFNYLNGLGYPIEIVGGTVVRGSNGSSREKGVDTEIVLKMVELSNEYDTALLVTGDGDMLGAVQRVQHQGARVEVISFPSVTSKALRAAADVFTDITQLEIFKN